MESKKEEEKNIVIDLEDRRFRGVRRPAASFLRLLIPPYHPDLDPRVGFQLAEYSNLPRRARPETQEESSDSSSSEEEQSRKASEGGLAAKAEEETKESEEEQALSAGVSPTYRALAPLPEPPPDVNRSEAPWDPPRPESPSVWSADTEPISGNETDDTSRSGMEE